MDGKERAEQIAKERTRAFGGAIQIHLDEESASYKEAKVTGTTVNGGLAGRVPISDRRGSKADGSKYGVIARGQVYRGGEPVGVFKTPVPTVDIYKYGGDEAECKDDEQEETEDLPQQGETPDGGSPAGRGVASKEDWEADAEDILRKIRDENARLATKLETAKETKAGNSVEVKLSGTFGSFKGRYSDCIEYGNMVVLMYNLSDSVFSPPTNCYVTVLRKEDNKVFKTLYSGVEFEVDSIQKGFIVLEKKEDEG